MVVGDDGGPYLVQFGSVTASDFSNGVAPISFDQEYNSANDYVAYATIDDPTLVATVAVNSTAADGMSVRVMSWDGGSSDFVPGSPAKVNWLAIGLPPQEQGQ